MVSDNEISVLESRGMGKRPRYSEEEKDEVKTESDNIEGVEEEEEKRKTVKGNGKGMKNGAVKGGYKCTGFWKEDHNQPLFGVAVNTHLKEEEGVMFATVGSNRVTVYEAASGGQVRLLQCYADPDTEENFYSCAWSYDSDTKKPILAAGGARGIVRLFSPAAMTCVRSFVGHGNSINEVKFHPQDPNLLLSVSKDHALRLWNIKTEHNIAIFGGVEGHRDEVLSADFNLEGTKIVSAGMDHSLKIWQFDSEALEEAVKLSYTHDTLKTKTVFPTELCHFPDFSTRDIHRNYVDCCRWFGDFVLSKSCENSIVCWKPGTLSQDQQNEREREQRSTIIHKLDIRDCEIWFVRFSTDLQEKTLALGNTRGKIYTWDLTVSDPTSLRPSILSNPKCNTAVRQTSLSRDGAVLIAVCDDGTIWRWDRV